MRQTEALYVKLFLHAFFSAVSRNRWSVIEGMSELGVCVCWAACIPQQHAGSFCPAALTMKPCKRGPSTHTVTASEVMNCRLCWLQLPCNLESVHSPWSTLPVGCMVARFPSKWPFYELVYQTSACTEATGTAAALCIYLFPLSQNMPRNLSTPRCLLCMPAFRSQLCLSDACRGFPGAALSPGVSSAAAEGTRTHLSPPCAGFGIFWGYGLQFVYRLTRGTVFLTQTHYYR